MIFVVEDLYDANPGAIFNHQLDLPFKAGYQLCYFSVIVNESLSAWFNLASQGLVVGVQCLYSGR